MFFARNRAYGIFEYFEIHKFVDSVSLSEARYQFELVLMDSSDEVVRYTNIKRAMPSTGKNVDVKLAVSRDQSSAPNLVYPGSAIQCATPAQDG